MLFLHFYLRNKNDNISCRCYRKGRMGSCNVSRHFVCCIRNTDSHQSDHLMKDNHAWGWKSERDEPPDCARSLTTNLYVVILPVPSTLHTKITNASSYTTIHHEMGFTDTLAIHNPTNATIHPTWEKVHVWINEAHFCMNEMVDLQLWEYRLIKEHDLQQGYSFDNQ